MDSSTGKGRCQAIAYNAMPRDIRGLQISRTRHDGLQAVEVTQGGSVVKDTTCDGHRDTICNDMGGSGWGWGY